MTRFCAPRPCEGRSDPRAGALDIAARLAEVNARIRAAERRFERAAGEVGLLAVSKRQSVEKIRAALFAGQRAFAENYLQEGLDKQALLAGAEIEWHFIGRIQSNKTRSIAEHFDWVHSLADLRHAQRLSDQRPAERGPLQACIQINLSSEGTKGGVAPHEAAALLAGCDGLPRLVIRGLMTLPAPTLQFDEQRRPFRALRRLRDKLASPERPLDVLSMGMTDDLEAAVAEGARLVRIGTGIFGPRGAGRP